MTSLHRGLCGLLSILLLPCWARGLSCSWPDAIHGALQGLPKNSAGGFNDSTLDALYRAPRLDPRSWEPLADALQSLPVELRVKSPEALADLIASGPDSSQVRKLSQAMERAAQEAHDLADDRARRLIKDFRMGFSPVGRGQAPNGRLDHFYDSMSDLLELQFPYLSSRNRAVLSKMREGMDDWRRRLREDRSLRWIQHAGDILAEDGWEGVLPMPARLDISELKGYQSDPFQPFPFLGHSYSSAYPLKPMNIREREIVDQYQAAINFFVPRAEKPPRSSEFSQIDIVELEGDLAEGVWSGLGLVKDQPFDKAERNLVKGRYPFAPVELSFTAALPVRRSHHQGALTPTQWSEIQSSLRDIQKDAYERFGIFISPQPILQNHLRRGMPIGAIVGNGLFRHIAVNRLVQSMMPDTEMHKMGVGEFIRGLGFRDGELQKLRGALVLFVGAGAGISPKFLQDFFGVRSVAMDWWYGLTPDEIGRHIRIKSESRPVPGEYAVEDFPALVVAGLLPTPSFLGNPFREVILGDLVKNFLEHNRKWAWEMLQEALRITEPGGRVRFRIDARRQPEITALVDGNFPAHRLEFPPAGAVIHKPTP